MLLSRKVLPENSTSSLASTIEPVPEGTPETDEPGIAKFVVLFSKIWLLNTRVRRPSCTGGPGRLKTRMPPALAVAMLSYTSASVEFSISMPATFSCTRLRRTMMLRD